MKVEVLFPEFSNLYGDVGNMFYLKKCAPNFEFIYTNNQDVPYFVNNDVDMVYIGSMNEKHQLITIDKLKPYLTRIKELIDQDVIIFCTGNALELFGKYIQFDNEKHEALGLFPFYAIGKDEVRYNYMFVGEFEGFKVVGHKSQFSLCYGEFKHPMMKVIKGFGHNLNDKFEGIRYKNFIATYVLGPLLPLNPLFTKYLLNLLNYKGELIFEKEAIEAYEYRLKQLMQDNANINLGYHGC